MLELLAFFVIAAVGVALLVGAVVVLPLLILGGLLEGLVFLLVLPFRLLAGLLAAGVGIVAALVKGAGLLALAFGGLLLLAGGLLVLPLLPLLLVFGLIWLLTRSSRPRAVNG